MSAKIKEHLAAIEAELGKPKGFEVVKAKKGNTRFKDTSVWVKLPTGKYLHVQSGKVAKASRLVGYTEVAYTA